MKKPKWWTGWWVLKSVLIWFAVFLIWYPVFSMWPHSTVARLLTVLFGLCLLPLTLAQLLGVLGDWCRLFGSVHAIIKGLRDKQ